MNRPPESPAVPRARAPHGRLSIERKLPLLITALLAVLLAGALGLTYATLRDGARETAEARLARAAQQLGTLAQTSVERIEATVLDKARVGVVRRAAAGDSAAVADATEELDELLAPRDTGLTVELWSADGRRVAFAGTDIRARPAPPGAEGTPHPGFDASPGSLARSDSAGLGELYLVDGVVHFWAVAPVVADGRRIGTLARQYRIAEGNGVDETIRALTGADVASYYRNADGGLWTTLGGRVAAAPQARDSSDDGLVVRRDGVGRLLAVESPVAGSPFVIVLELPLRSALAAPRETVARLALLSLLLLLAGAVGAWLVSRTITRRLAALTAAAESVAAGDYGVRVEDAGHDELARLGSSFNHMAAEVGASRDELELQTEEAQAAAEELEQSNAQLGGALASLEESEAQFRALADAIPQLSWMAFADGAIFWYNQRWYEYTGTTPEEMEGWGWQAVHDPAVVPTVLERWKRSIHTGTPFEMEFPLRGADGRYRWFLTRVEPVRDRDGRIVRWFGTNTDVQALREAREAAEAANRAKSDFLAIMSHELRTPLNAIGGYTELLALGIRGPVTDAQRHDLERIRASQQHLLGLIAALLDMSRIEAGRVTYEVVPTPVAPFVGDVVDLVAPLAEAKALVMERVEDGAGLAVLADREKLRQILLNVFSNAIRYTPPGGRITVAAEARDGIVAIRTTDTGIGIAADALERIFEPFVQLDRSLTRVREGVGLGLSISRDLARGMGGEITVESRPGNGASFTLTLPRAA
ncbi:MAG TPA: ATP-binding protein, partial [Gemmatimonadaceae bacterium]